tara:strand:- start:31595 stop:32878 length:1284 start_codon:yes stop_codon:yes gene_type:complete
MKKINLIELNEINFEIIQQYINKNPGCFQGFEKLLNLRCFKSTSEDVYQHIEPWIQWPSVHTCQTYDQHKIFRLGDIVHYCGEQIFEMIEKKGYSVGCISPMNTINNLKKPAYFIPDPWTNTKSDKSFLSKSIHRAMKQAVNDNSEGKISLSTYAILLWVIITKTQIKNWFTFFKLFLSRGKPWNKALILDLLLADLFTHLKKKNKENFSCLFLNAFAHIQHHYFLNSKMYNGSVKNSQSYIDIKDDPISDAIKVYDRIIINLLDNSDEKLILATGLRQVPIDKQEIYYRLKNHQRFLNALGLKNFNVQPRMTRDFLITFKSDNDLKQSYELLGELKCNGQKLFGVIEQRKNGLFVTLTYSKELKKNDCITINNRSLILEKEFVFVALKNAKHDALGYVFTNFSPRIFKSNDHVSIIGKEIINYFDV